MKALVGLLALFASLNATATATTSLPHTKTLREDLPTRPVQYVDMNYFYGAWYVVASQPTKYEHDCFCSRQVMTPKEKGSDEKIRIDISCNRFSPQGQLKQVSLSAKNVEPQTNAKFRATYKFFFKFDYWVIGLATDYSWAVITNPSGSMLYILSKTPSLAPDQYASALHAAAEQRDTSKLQRISHQGCTYP